MYCVLNMFPAPSLIQHAHNKYIYIVTPVPLCVAVPEAPLPSRHHPRCAHSRGNRQLKPSNSSLVELKPAVPLTTSIAFELTHLCISGGRIPPQVAGAREMCLTVGAVVRISKLLPVPLTAASP